MKIDTADLLEMIGDVTQEITDEHPDWSVEALEVMKALINTLFERLFKKEIEELGISVKEYNKMEESNGKKSIESND